MKLPAFKQAARESFEEVYEDTPKSVIKSGKTGAERTAMLRAIALSKAERRMKRST
jgi:hypothetical protein